eukprot:6213261-Pleurochrysis_carterae.AAC.1
MKSTQNIWLVLAAVVASALVSPLATSTMFACVSSDDADSNVAEDWDASGQAMFACPSDTDDATLSESEGEADAALECMLCEAEPASTDSTRKTGAAAEGKGAAAAAAAAAHTRTAVPAYDEQEAVVHGAEEPDAEADARKVEPAMESNQAAAAAQAMEKNLAQATKTGAPFDKATKASGPAEGTEASDACPDAAYDEAAEEQDNDEAGMAGSNATGIEGDDEREEAEGYDSEPEVDSGGTGGSFGRKRTPAPWRRADDSGMTDGRGKYSRESARKKETHKRRAYRHYDAVTGGTFGVPCLSSCPFERKCARNMTMTNLIRAHEHVFGTRTTAKPLNDGSVVYDCENSTKKCMKVWRALAKAAITKSADNPKQRVENFTVDDIGPVCAAYWAAAYGISKGTANYILRKARNFTAHADDEWAEAGDLGDVGFDDDEPEPVAKEETIAWWVMWLELEDQMPNEPVIVHRRVVWESAYKQEYLADMEYWGVKMEPVSRSRWIELRKHGLARLSAEYYGVEEDGKTPKCMLTLKERANHSNFGKCDECADIGLKWAEFRANAKRYTTSEVIEMKRELFKHLHVMRAERRAAMALQRHCAGENTQQLVDARALNLQFKHAKKTRLINFHRFKRFVVPVRRQVRQ